jgi:hypothetical protein
MVAATALAGIWRDRSHLQGPVLGGCSFGLPISDTPVRTHRGPRDLPARVADRSMAERNTKIGLGRGPLERHAIAGPFLQRRRSVAPASRPRRAPSQVKNPSATHRKADPWVRPVALVGAGPPEVSSAA